VHEPRLGRGRPGVGRRLRLLLDPAVLDPAILIATVLIVATLIAAVLAVTILTPDVLAPDVLPPDILALILLGPAAMRRSDRLGLDRRVHRADTVVPVQQGGQLLSLLGADAEDDARLTPGRV
jgi:hypothetical protein